MNGVDTGVREWRQGNRQPPPPIWSPGVAKERHPKATDGSISQGRDWVCFFINRTSVDFRTLPLCKNPFHILSPCPRGSGESSSRWEGRRRIEEGFLKNFLPLGKRGIEGDFLGLKEIQIPLSFRHLPLPKGENSERRRP